MPRPMRASMSPGGTWKMRLAVATTRRIGSSTLMDVARKGWVTGTEIVTLE